MRRVSGGAQESETSTGGELGRVEGEGRVGGIWLAVVGDVSGTWVCWGEPGKWGGFPHLRNLACGPCLVPGYLRARLRPEGPAGQGRAEYRVGPLFHCGGAPQASLPGGSRGCPWGTSEQAEPHPPVVSWLWWVRRVWRSFCVTLGSSLCLIYKISLLASHGADDLRGYRCHPPKSSTPP